ncbi:hypothetical protein GCM10010193_24910 [Kitasatospora atroaurantiaca]|uniref:Tetratricopeptide repeat protein n=1 Tax=Kitasatospora atroaurantiaca TaxID=285545 RepID=A0A561F0P6_9ACTN|nr:hypothetical protein [Kitasatospora atroaurantiaca]TWE21438.1 hypothetical protein FB465_6621 [Kitasatospora atroaurantiaca]
MSGDEKRSGPRKARPVPQAQVPPGPLRTFKKYLYRLYLDAGAPALEVIAHLVAEAEELPGAPGKDTISRLLSTERLPSQEDAVSVAAVLAERAGKPAAEAMASARELWTEACDAPPSPVRTVRQWDPLRLGVHRAVSTDGADPGLLNEYVVRRHDRILRDRLRSADSERGSDFALLVGSSSTGKTRAAFEAVLDVLPDWHLVSPSGGAPELLALVADESLGPRTVVWLDHAQRFLAGEQGEEVASALTALLERVTPLVVLGTLRTDHLQRLTARPNAEEAESDRFHVRALLAANNAEIDVPATMAGHLPELVEKAARDPRLADALRASAADGRVLQHLTGGPELVRRYECGPGRFFTVIEYALLTAAVDARRLGHAGALPGKLLAEAVVGYLPTSARVTDDGWFATAAGSLCHHLDEHGRGELAALIAERVAPGFGEADGYRPDDYLDQHLRRKRAHLAPPRSLWEAAARHAHTPADLYALGRAAQDRRRLGHAVQLYRRAMELGGGPARAALAALLEETGESAAAERAVAGSARAWILLAAAREATHDDSGAERAYREAANAGEPLAWVALARKREQTGDQRGAEELASRALLAGSSQAWLALARLRESSADHEGAMRAFKEAAWAGELWAWTGLARLHERSGDRSAAELAYLEAASVGASAWTDLVRLRWTGGDTEGAEAAAEHAAEAGDGEGWSLLARMREIAGDGAGAETAYLRAARVGVTAAWVRTAGLREAAGDPIGGNAAAEQAARRGDPGAWALLARLRQQTGDPSAADVAAAQAARAGDAETWTVLARMRQLAGDTPGAERAATEAAENGDPQAWAVLARTRERAGDTQGAELAAARAVDVGGIGAWTALGRVREQLKDVDGAERAYRRATELGDADAWGALGGLYEEDCYRAGAERAYRVAVDAGDVTAWEGLVRVLRNGDQEHARYGLEADGIPAGPLAR